MKLTGTIMFLHILVSPVLLPQVSKLIVVDQLVTDKLNEIKNTYSGSRLLLLPETGNPISIIAGELRNNSYSEIHIFVLTKPGSIVFDEITILPENIEDYSADFIKWKDSATGRSTVVIHSDVLTSVPEGNFLINRLEALTGKKVIVE